MALITCPDCGTDVSNTAEFCPDCGYRVRGKRRKARLLRAAKRVGTWSLFLFVGLVLLGQLTSGVDHPSIDREGITRACLDSIGERRTMASSVRAVEPSIGSLGEGRYLAEGPIHMTYYSGTRERRYRCIVRSDSSGWTVTKAEIR